MRIKKLAVVDTGVCVSCGTCEVSCPKGAIRIWKGCWAVVDAQQCIGCKKCSRVCPADCVSLVERHYDPGDLQAEKPVRAGFTIQFSKSASAATQTGFRCGGFPFFGMRSQFVFQVHSLSTGKP